MIQTSGKDALQPDMAHTIYAHYADNYGPILTHWLSIILIINFNPFLLTPTIVLLRLNECLMTSFQNPGYRALAQAIRKNLEWSQFGNWSPPGGQRILWTSLWGKVCLNNVLYWYYYNINYKEIINILQHNMYWQLKVACFNNDLE